MKIRKAFQMFLLEGFQKEYERRHRLIWGELVEVLNDHGVANYTIFIASNGRELFGYAEIDSEQQWTDIASSPICQKWWAYMSDIMPTNSDLSPLSYALEEVFHLD